MKIKKAKVITVTSSKGGIGKTMFILNLSGIYTKLQVKTLLIDLDIYTGGISTALNLPDNKTVYNLVDDIMNNRYKNGDDYLSKVNEYIDVLPAPKDPRQGGKIEPRYIEQLITNYRNRYDLILIDTSHILINSNIMALDSSDIILYMLSNDPLDLANSKSMMAIFKDIDRENVKVILNESFSQDKKYFSTFDIKSVIKRNIDYILNSSMYVKNIDKYVMDGEILTLNSRLSFKSKRDQNCYINIAKDLLKEDDINEEEQKNISE